MKPIKTSLPLVQAKEAFAAVLPHISTDDVTPVITCAEMRGTRIVATDRYSVAGFELGVEVPEPIMLPRAAIMFIAKLNLRGLLMPTMLGDYRLDIEAHSPDPTRLTDVPVGGVPPTRLSVSSKKWANERVMLFEHIRGNFPPVAERLVDGFEPAAEAYPVMLKPEFVERVTAFARQYHRDQAVKFELGKPTDSGKPSPIRTTIGNFTALIQPNLMLR